MTLDVDIFDMNSAKGTPIYAENFVHRDLGLHPLLAAHEKLAPLESS